MEDNKYFDNEAFNTIVNKLTKNLTIGGVYVAPTEDNAYIECLERFLVEHKQAVKDLETGIALIKLANTLGVKFVDEEK
jgi:hypothetical protein